jgi:hypothetical protein
MHGAIVEQDLAELHARAPQMISTSFPSGSST